MHFSRILTAVVVTCATGAFAVQLTEGSALRTIQRLSDSANVYISEINGDDGRRDPGNVILASLFAQKDDFVIAANNIGTMTSDDRVLTDDDGSNLMDSIDILTRNLVELLRVINDQACPQNDRTCDYVRSIRAGLLSLNGPTGASPDLFYNHLASWFDPNGDTQRFITSYLGQVKDQLVVTMQGFPEQPN